MIHHLIITILGSVGFLIALGAGMFGEHIDHLQDGIKIFNMLTEHTTEATSGLASMLVTIYSITQIFKSNKPDWDNEERRSRSRDSRKKKKPAPTVYLNRKSVRLFLTIAAITVIATLATLYYFGLI